MGAASSEGLFMDQCLQVCPQFAQSSQLRKRQQEAEERKKHSVGYTLKHGEGGEGDAAAGNPRRESTIMGRLSTFLGGTGALEVEDQMADKEAGVEGTLRSRIAQRNARSHDEELLHSAMRGDLRKCKKALESGAKAGFTNARGVTPLMLGSSSCGKEALEVIKAVFDFQVDVSTRDNNGWTALHHACRNGKTEAAKWLISVSCDPASLTADGKTTLMLATIESKGELVRELIKLKPVKAQVGARDSLHCTALHFAVKSGSHEILKMLLDNGAKVNAEDIDGKMPIAWAAEHGRMDSVKTLVKKSAEVDCKDKSQRTPLLYSCLNSYEGVALWLLKKSADPYYRDVSGDCALTVAEDMGLSEVKKTVKMRRLELEEHED